MADPTADPTVDDDLTEEDQTAASAVEVDTDAPTDETEGEPAAVVEAEDDELVITLGDEPAPEHDAVEETPVIRQIRQKNRELVQALRNTEAELRRVKTAPVQAAEPEDPGPLPKISDFDFDEDKHQEAVSAWTAKKSAADARKAQRQEAEQEGQRQWLKRVAGYESAKKALKVPNFSDAEDNVLQALSVTQQGLLLKVKEPEKLVYALGMSPKRLQTLAAIADPIDFVYAVGELRQEMKVQPRKKPPVPERVPSRGGVTGYSAMDSTLEKLRADAEKTGDYTKVRAYKENLNAKKAA